MGQPLEPDKERERADRAEKGRGTVFKGLPVPSRPVTKDSLPVPKPDAPKPDPGSSGGSP